MFCQQNLKKKSVSRSFYSSGQPTPVNGSGITFIPGYIHSYFCKQHIYNFNLIGSVKIQYYSKCIILYYILYIFLVREWNNGFFVPNLVFQLQLYLNFMTGFKPLIRGGGEGEERVHFLNLVCVLCVCR